MKVRIRGSSVGEAFARDTNSEEPWYKNLVGQILNVRPDDFGTYEVIDGPYKGKIIFSDDCDCD